MIGKFLRPFIRRHGYDLIRYPMPEWYLLRDGLAEIFSTLRINCVIDVGANRGQYGEFLRIRLPDDSRLPEDATIRRLRSGAGGRECITDADQFHRIGPRVASL